MPPYCGSPNLAHHFPAVEVGVVVVVVVVTVVGFVVGVVDGVVVGVVFVPQDGSSRDSTIRHDKINHIILLFTLSNLFILYPPLFFNVV